MEFIAFLVPVFFILAAALTIAALVSIMRAQHLEQTTRIIWVVVVLMLPTLGAIAWFIARPTNPTLPRQ